MKPPTIVSAALLCLGASTISGGAVGQELFPVGQELFAAWVPPRGEAFMTFGYGNAFVKNHYFSTGEQIDVGHIRYNDVEMQLGYSVTDRLAVSAGLPYRATKYDGLYPHSVIDNGAYHGTFQDYHLEARYQIVSDPAAITPFVGATLPSHDYVTFAHSAAGFDLWEYPVGVLLGRWLDPWISDAYVQGTYTYTFVERVLGLRHDRSTLDLDLGKFVTPTLGVRGLLTWQRTLGGLDLPQDLSQPFAWPHTITRENFLDVGGGLIYVVSSTVDVYASYIGTVSGTNTEKIQQGISVGVNWGFSPARFFRGRGTGPAAQEAD